MLNGFYCFTYSLHQLQSESLVELRRHPTSRYGRVTVYSSNLTHSTHCTKFQPIKIWISSSLVLHEHWCSVFAFQCPVSPAELKFQSFLSRWHKLETSVDIAVQINVPKRLERGAIQAQIVVSCFLLFIPLFVMCTKSVQCSTAQHSGVQYVTVQCSAAQNSTTVRCSTEQCSAVQGSTDAILSKDLHWHDAS